MEIRLRRSELLSELVPMQGIVERKTTIPVLSHLLLTAREDRLHLAATDLDVSLTSSCEADVKRDGGVAVQAKKLFEIVRSLVADDVALVLDDPRSLTIRAGRSRFKIHGLAPDDFPTLPVVDDKAAIEIPFADLRRMIGKVLFAVSAEESRFQLNGALLKLKKGALELVATDGHRLALVEAGLDGADGDHQVLVPRKALQELQRLEGEGNVAYRRGEHHLSFRLGRRELVCRILEGSFPDYERVIAKDNDKKAVFERKALVDGVQRVAHPDRRPGARSAAAVRARPAHHLDPEPGPGRGGRGAGLRLRRAGVPCRHEPGLPRQLPLGGRDREGAPRAQGREHAVRGLPGGRPRRAVPLRHHADAAVIEARRESFRA